MMTRLAAFEEILAQAAAALAEDPPIQVKAHLWAIETHAAIQAARERREERLAIIYQRQAAGESLH